MRIYSLWTMDHCVLFIECACILWHRIQNEHFEFLVICLHLLFGWAFHFFWYSSYFNSFWLLKMPSFVKTTAICNRSSSEGGKLFISLMCPQKVHTSIWNYQNADQNENVLRKWNAMHQSPWGKMLPPIFFFEFHARECAVTNCLFISTRVFFLLVVKFRAIAINQVQHNNEPLMHQHFTKIQCNILQNSRTLQSIWSFAKIFVKKMCI